MALNQSGLLFMPKGWQRAAVLQWLKRIHAWTGFWGALLFLLMGSSGFLLNHRNILKIETAKPVEVSNMDVAVRPGQFANADAMGKWAKATLALPVEGREPQAERGKKKPDERFMGKTLPQVEKWTRTFMLPDTKVTVDYVPGAPNVTVKREAVGILATIKNLHKGVGIGVAWVLLIDTIAGALIAMSLTGFLLWTRLHGTRLLAGGLAGGSLSWAAIATWPYFAA
jgi:uncharacterized protein